MTDAPSIRESPASSLVRSIEDLTGPAGRLEALLNEGHPDAPYSALLCHPHPLGGGTMHNKVVYHAMKAFQARGLPVLRFNFRGTGLSAGMHDEGRGEVDDVRVALDWLDRRFSRPILFAGFSFGSYVGLRACCGDARVKGLVALGLPIGAEGREYRYPFLSGCTQPKLFLGGDQDEFGPRAQVEAVVAAAAPPAELVFVPGSGHFFTGRLNVMQDALGAWLDRHFFSSPTSSSPRSMESPAKSPAS